MTSFEGSRQIAQENSLLIGQLQGRVDGHGVMITEVKECLVRVEDKLDIVCAHIHHSKGRSSMSKYLIGIGMWLVGIFVGVKAGHH